LAQTDSKEFFIKPEDYYKALSSQEDFFIQFQRFTQDVDSQIIKMIHRYLEHYDLLFHKDTIISIVKELINNAIKANLKRLYFESAGLNINDINNYRQGMETFKDTVFQSNESELIKSLQGSRYMVRVTFSSTSENLSISVINNNPILESELNKIKSRVAKAYKYQDISEAFIDVLDDSEGAGLGLIMALMLLKNSGFPQNVFTISRNETLTSVNLSIPHKVMTPEIHFKVTEEIMKEIEEIPALPDNIKEIRMLLRDPDSEIKDIAKSISRDPGLTASIMKLANSAGYVTMNRLETIDEAVKIIGIKGINTLLIATGVQKVVETRYKRYEAVWNDSYKRAFYAQLITKRINESSKLGDQVYLSALLADIGKIVMLSLQSEIIDKIKKINGFKGMLDSTLIEEISLGISHSSLGALICKKWNFNESLIKTIELHHRPHRAEGSYKNLIFTVYLADIMVEIENNKFRFEIADDGVLDFFRLNDKKKFEEYHLSLKEIYNTKKNF
jgi:HD-like signal output (HDOD) protein